LLACACESTWFKFWVCFYLPLCFSQLHLCLYFYLPSNTFSTFIYLSPHFSPCLYVLHSLQLYFHQYLFLFLCLFLPVSLFLSPYVTLFVIVSSTLIHYLSMCVSLTSIDSIFPSLFVYITFFVSISCL
jgi:hypothetical protein